VPSLRNTLVKAAGKKQPVPLTKWIEIHDKAAVASKISKAAKKAGLPEPHAFVPLSKRLIRPRKPKQVKLEPNRFTKVSEELTGLGSPGNLNVINQNRQKLGLTREGEEINQAVSHWSDSINTDPFRSGAELWLQGRRAGIDASGVFSPQYEAGAKLMEAVIAAPQTKQTMHRGIAVSKKKWSLDSFEERYKRGTVYDNQISSYSKIPEKAAEFSGKGSDPDNISVIFNIQPGARGLNIEPISAYLGEAETIIGGRFEVLGTYRVETITRGNIAETLHIEVRQIESFTRMQ
jgi:hypothetical protein